MPLFSSTITKGALRLFVAMSLVVTSTAWAQTDTGSRVGELPDADASRFEDWAIQCRQPDSARSEVCVMFQRQVLDDDRTVLMMTVRNVPNQPEPVAMLQVPLGVLLQPGLSISVDGGESLDLRYSLCDNNGCIATFPLAGRIKDALKKGLTAEVVVTTADGREIVIGVSLKGFTAALEAL